MGMWGWRVEGDFSPGPQEPVALGSTWGSRFFKLRVTPCTVHRGDRLHGLSQTQTISLQKGGTRKAQALEKPKVLASWSPLPLPDAFTSLVLQEGVGETQAGGGQASFTARQDLLISRTNSDVLDLEHIYKPSENICEQARDSPPA